MGKGEQLRDFEQESGVIGLVLGKIKLAMV